MPRWTRLAATLAASSILLLGCGQDPDSTTTGDADSGADTQTEGNRESEPCLGEDAATDGTVEVEADDAMGSTESEQTCTEGNDGDTTSGNVDSGGDPGTGTPSDGTSGDSGGSDTGTG